MTGRHRLDSSWWRHRSTAADGSTTDTVVAGSPLRLFRLGRSGSRLADVLESDGSIPPGTESLARRFVDAGVIHPIVDADPNPPYDRVSVVVPAHDERHADLTALVATLRADGFDEIVIVDDGSRFSLAPVDGALVVRRDAAGGPGLARNTGVAVTSRDLIMFIDADTLWTPGAFGILWPHLIDERVGVVAPRVASRPDSDRIATYEVDSSPLDLGSEPARVRPSTRVSYVPSAAMLVRRSVFDAIGGFEPSMRFGEDVDFVWRVVHQGHVVRYEPSCVVHHLPRRSVIALMRQRFGYGSAAARLESRHPGAVRPLRVNRWSALGWGLVGLGHPIVGVAVGVGSTAALARKLGDTPDRWLVAGRLAGLGNLHAGRLMASAITRVWWPLVLVASLFSRRARRVFVAAAVLPNLWRWSRRKPGLDPVRYVALRVLDDMSYGAGVWSGVRAEKKLGAITPRFD